MKTYMSPSFRASALLALIGTLPTLSSAQTTYSWTGANSGDWSAASNWNPSTAAPGGLVIDIVQFDTDATNSAISIGADTIINSLAFTSDSGSYNFSGSTLTLKNSGASMSNTSGALQTFASRVNFDSGGTINVDSGSEITFSAIVGRSTGTGGSLIVSGGGTVNFTGTFSSFTVFTFLKAAEGATINFNTQSTSAANNFQADGGRMNLFRATGSTGIALQLVGDGSEIYLSKAALGISAESVQFRGDTSNKTLTFGSDFSGTGTATYGGQVRYNTTSGAGTNNTYRLYAAADNTLVLSGTMIDTYASGTGTKVEISGPGLVRFSGAAANTSVTPISISAGSTLELAKTAGIDAIAGGSVTINTDGTLRLAASNQIGDATTLTFAGGTFNAGAFTESLGAFSVDSSGGTIDFGGSAGSLTFASLSSIAGVLTINGWTENASIVFTDGSGWDSTALSRVVFSGYGAAQFDTLTGELYASAIPEPASTAALLGALALVSVTVIRRRVR